MISTSAAEIQFLLEHTTVIIRSVGERTEQVCYTLLAQAFPKEHIFIVRETPFSQAIRQSFLLALAQNRPWTLVIDADVLIDREPLRQLIQTTQTLDPAVFQLQGLILDKFIPVQRPAGNHLYRTALIDKAIPLIPAEGTSLRPETDMLNAMARYGHPWVQSAILVGVHDFEQSNADIYRKCFLHAHKHDYLYSILYPYWKSQADADQDFEVALLGFEHGQTFKQTVLVDKSFLQEQVNEILHEKGITEKGEFLNSFSVANAIQINTDSPFLSQYQETIYPIDFDLKYFDRTSLLPKGFPGNITKRIFRFIRRRLTWWDNLKHS